jgi:branched-chain amino acid transport system permease protein
VTGLPVTPHRSIEERDVIDRLSKLRPQQAVVLGVSALLALFVIFQGRSGTGAASFSVGNLGTWLLAGLAIGALYALYATGLVVVYNTTGIFNFSQAAIGAFCAFLYWELRVNRDWPAPIALFVVICLVAPTIGVVLDRLIMRRLEGAPLVIQLMVTVGVMYFLLTVTGQIWQQDKPRKLVAFFGTDGVDIGPSRVTYHRLIVLAVSILVAVVLRILFRSRIGVAMRAVVDNRNLAALTGARPDVISALAWAIGATLAAIGGILIAPEFELDPSNLNAVLVIAFAAAAFGQLKSIPWALVGALLIGLGKQFMAQFLKLGGDWQFAEDALAPLILFAVVLALPQARLEVGRATKNLRRHERTSRPWEAIVGGLALLLVFAALSGGWLNFVIWDPGKWNQIALNRAVVALALAVIGMSLVPLTGWAGQLNLAPMAFAGFGAFLHLKLANGGDTAHANVFWLLAVGLICAPLGALVALPAARLRGLYLALASMAFAQVMALLFFPHPSAGFRSGQGTLFKPFTVLGLDLSDRRSLMMMILVIFVLFMVALVTLRRSRFGRRLVAINDSQAAAATLGVSVVATKMVVYAVSAAIAGVGGALFATASGSVDGVRTFTLDTSIPIVLLMAIGGLAFPIAAIFTTFQLVFLALGERLHQANAPSIIEFAVDFLRIFGPGLGAIGMVVNQRGAAFRSGRDLARYLPWRPDAREEYAAEKAKKRDPEPGDLGLTRPFTPDEVALIDRRLGIADELAARPAVLDLREASLGAPTS